MPFPKALCCTMSPFWKAVREGAAAAAPPTPPVWGRGIRERSTVRPVPAGRAVPPVAVLDMARVKPP